jgi:hypothetical protein
MAPEAAPSQALVDAPAQHATTRADDMDDPGRRRPGPSDPHNAKVCRAGSHRPSLEQSRAPVAQQSGHAEPLRQNGGASPRRPIPALPSSGASRSRRPLPCSARNPRLSPAIAFVSGALGAGERIGDRAATREARDAVTTYVRYRSRDRRRRACCSAACSTGTHGEHRARQAQRAPSASVVRAIRALRV